MDSGGGFVSDLAGALVPVALAPQGWAVLVMTVLVFVAFVLDRWPIATISLAILAFLPALFTLFPMQGSEGPINPLSFLGGFGHPALVTICALMILGHALVLTGALEPFARRIAKLLETNPTVGFLVVLAVPAMASGIFNDTPLVVLLIPLVLAACRRASVDATKYLLPMNYAVLIGGMSTTIGTSTNLIVVALAADLAGLTIGMFDFYLIVAMAAVPALLYLWLLAPRLIRSPPIARPNLVDHVFDAELYVSEGGGLDGKQLRDVLVGLRGRVQLRAIRRRGRSLTRLPSLVLKPGDRIQVQGRAADLKSIESEYGTHLHSGDLTAKSGDASPDDVPVETQLVAQLIVTADSPLVDRTVRDLDVAGQHGVVVVGLRPVQGGADWRYEGIAQVKIRTGDILLLQGREDQVRDAQTAGLGLLLDEQFSEPRKSKSHLALGVLGAVVVVSAFKLMPIVNASLIGVLALLLTKTLTWREVSSALSTKIILLVSASIALGEALQVTGVTAAAARGLADVSGNAPAWVILMLLMGLSGVLTNFVSNNAAAAICTPLAIALARLLGVPLEPFVLAVLFGCNLCYATPMGYQTNLLVMNAAGYRFADFARVGIPLFILMWLTLSALLVQRYNL